MSCENISCPWRLDGNCFTALFLGREALFQGNRDHWKDLLLEENAMRHKANMAPITLELFRAQKKEEVATTARQVIIDYCRPQDASLREALAHFDAVIVS